MHNMCILRDLHIYLKTTPLNTKLKGICRDYTEKNYKIISIEGRDFTDMHNMHKYMYIL